MFNWIKKFFTQKEHNVRVGSLVRITTDENTYPEVGMGKGYVGTVGEVFEHGIWVRVSAQAISYGFKSEGTFFFTSDEYEVVEY